MRWFMAGLAFAAVVGLAITTAAIEARNVHRRQYLQVVAERLEASQVSLVTEQLRFRRATSLGSLVRHWLALQARFDAEVQR